MVDNELKTIINDTGCNWLVSGQDLCCRSILLEAELAESVKRKYAHVLIVPEDRMTFTSSILLKSGLACNGVLPSRDLSYFPVFTPKYHEMRVSRFLQLLYLRGMSETEVERANKYLEFLYHLESLHTHVPVVLSGELITKYSSISKVESTINDLVREVRLSPMQCRELMEKYAEVSSVAPEIENFLSLLNDMFFRKNNDERKIARMSAQESMVFVIKKAMNPVMRKYMLQMIAWDIADACDFGKKIAVTLLEGPEKYDEEMLWFLEQINGYARVSLYSDDMFSGRSKGRQESLKGYFANYIYSYHGSMESCENISKQCGEIPIVRSSYSYDKDRRIANNKLVDRLFNTNRVDHYTQHVPVWEPKYYKETINSLPSGSCLVKTREDDFIIDIGSSFDNC